MGTRDRAVHSGIGSVRWRPVLFEDRWQVGRHTDVLGARSRRSQRRRVRGGLHTGNFRCDPRSVHRVHFEHLCHPGTAVDLLPTRESLGAIRVPEDWTIGGIGLRGWQDAAYRRREHSSRCFAQHHRSDPGNVRAGLGRVQSDVKAGRPPQVARIDATSAGC